MKYVLATIILPLFSLIGQNKNIFQMSSMGDRREEIMMFYFKWHIMACKYQPIGIEFHPRHWMNKASSKVCSWCHAIANLKTLELWHGICLSSADLLDNLMFCVRWLPTTLRLLKTLDECRVLWNMTNNSYSNAASDRRTLSCKQSPILEEKTGFGTLSSSYSFPTKKRLSLHSLLVPAPVP